MGALKDEGPLRDRLDAFVEGRSNDLSRDDVKELLYRFDVAYTDMRLNVRHQDELKALKAQLSDLKDQLAYARASTSVVS